jgi:hypothetical protein
MTVPLLRSIRLLLLGVAVMAAASRSTLRAQPCQPARIDSLTVQHWVDSLEHRRPRPAWVDSVQSRPRRARHELSVRAIGVQARGGCWTAAAVNWEQPLRGALALLTPDGAHSDITEYADIGSLQPAGPNRLAFSYRVGAGSGYGRGVRSYRFVVLCSFGTWHWATCLDMPQLDEHNTAPEWVGPDSSAGLYTKDSAAFVVQGDSVLVHRSVEWMTVYDGATLGPGQLQDLGTTVVRLPRFRR